MNLGQYLAKLILEDDHSSIEDYQPTIALFPGNFKPPYKGHTDVINKLLKSADQVVILMSPEIKDGISTDESEAVWDLYKPTLEGYVEIKISPSNPFDDAIKVIKDNPDTNFIVALGKDKINVISSIEKYANAKVFDAENIEGSEATNLRMALASKNNEEIEKYLPDGISASEFLNALNIKAAEEPQPETTPAEQPPAEPPMPEQPLQESPPINFEDEPPYENYVEQNRPKIEKASAVFNLPIPDMEYAFNSGGEVVLSDDMWSKLENSKSYKMKTLDDAIQHALKLGINPKPYIDQIKAGKDMPLPLVLCYGQDKYYLVGGEVVLSLYRALGSIPTVLQGTLNLQTKTLPEPMNEGIDTDQDKKLLKEFIGFAIKELNIQKLPTSLTLSRNNDKAKSMHSFGSFDPNNDKIWLYVKNRNMADLLRTLAHELVHHKQAEDNRLELNSGGTGSDIENEANAMAGVLLRKFGKYNENIYESKKKFGDYLFGDKESGVKIGWYDDEKEEDTPSEKELFNLLKKYADSEAETYSNINLDSLIPIFKKIKKQYPEIGQPKVSGYIYRGTSIPEEKLAELEADAETEPYAQGIILLNQTYSSRRQVQSWSTDYFPAAGFAVTTAERKGGKPVIMRAKAEDAELFFNPKFMEKLSTQLEDETFNITRPIPVDIMVIENYQDEFEDIESGYLHNK
jgi:hypothetical protein